MEPWKNEGHGSGRVHVCAAVGSWLHNEASLVERLEVKTMATVKLCSQTHTHRRQKHIVCVCATLFLSMQIIFPAFTSRMQLLALYVFKRVRVTNVTSVQDVIHHQHFWPAGSIQGSSGPWWCRSTQVQQADLPFLVLLVFSATLLDLKIVSSWS